MQLFVPPSILRVHTILCSYNRRQELTRLCLWATRKHLTRPLLLYRFRLQDEEVRLNRYELQHRWLSRIAYIIHLFNAICFPPSRYPRRGIAKGYTQQAMKYPLHTV